MQGSEAKMIIGEQEEIRDARERTVTQGNELVRGARHELSISEIRMFSFLLSRVKPGDDPNTKYYFTINECCRVLGIETNNGKNINSIRKILKKLRDTSFELEKEDGTRTTVGWLGKVWTNPGRGDATIQFDEDMIPYVFGLYRDFTSYQLLCTLAMKSAYSIRLYELLKSYAYIGNHDFDIEHFKDAVGCTKYSRFPDVRRRVIETAVKEINEYTDIEVKWYPITRGKKTVAVHFDIKQRSAMERYLASERANKRIETQAMKEKQIEGQLSIFDYISDAEKEDTD